MLPNGILETNTDEAARIVRVLSLNSPHWIQWRRTWIRIVDLAEECDPELFRRLMAYPDDLPNLATLKPPTNTRTEGIEQSCRARQERGDLPDLHIA